MTSANELLKLDSVSALILGSPEQAGRYRTATIVTTARVKQIARFMPDFNSATEKVTKAQ
jgi:hypothetical protein